MIAKKLKRGGGESTINVVAAAALKHCNRNLSRSL
jgi:hypothetical protein